MQLFQAMPYQGVYGLSEKLNKKAVLIYHARTRSFVYQLKDKGKNAICIQCISCEDFTPQRCRINGDVFTTNPSLSENHRCPMLSKEEVEAEQVYRQVRRRISGTKISGRDAYKKLKRRFLKVFGKRFLEHLRTLPDKTQLIDSLRRRARNVKIFPDDTDEEESGDEDVETSDDEESEN
uniref:Uncharacterized protein n=1 Tax=Panagrolaimus davidi TaxID=227884 RepID=A0A914QM12_9BILA